MSTRRALALSFLDRYAGLLLAVGASMVIARLLTPAEIGAFSVVMVLVSLVSALRDFGAGQYLLQERELNAERLRATWTVLLLTGLGFAVLVALAAVPLARFYADPRMAGIMWVLALNFAINPVASLSYAWLMREMRFGALASMRFGSSLAGAAVSVLLALQGHGPISLALGSLAGTLVNAAIALAYRPPSFPWWPSLRGTRRVVSFGGRISATALINNLGSGAPELLLGKLQGLADAAFYSRAAGLGGMFQKLVLDATQAVALPAFARERRETGRVGGSLPGATAAVLVLGWAFFGSVILLAHPVLLLLYGGQWVGAVELTRWVCAALAIGLPASLIPVALSASGAAASVLSTTLKVVPLQVTLAAVAAPFGLRAVGMAAVAGSLGGCWLWFAAGRRELQVSWPALAAVAARSVPMVAAILLGPAAVVLVVGWEPTHPLASVLAGAAGALAIGIPVLLRSQHPLGDEMRRAGHWLRTLRGGDN